MAIGHSVNKEHCYMNVMPPGSVGEVKKYPDIRVCPLGTGEQHLIRNCYGRGKRTKRERRK
jgi:hypothetical protein